MNRIKALRESRNLSQAKLAELLHFNQTAVSQWERGTTSPSIEALKKIARLFNVSIDYLVEFDVYKAENNRDVTITFSEEGKPRIQSTQYKIPVNESFHFMSQEGQKKVNAYIEDLSGNPQYQFNREERITAAMDDAHDSSENEKLKRVD